MKKSYPLMFAMALVSFILSVIAQWLMQKLSRSTDETIHTLGFLVQDFTVLSLFATAFFFFAGVANLVGSKFKKFIDPTLPVKLITIGTVIAFCSLIVLIILGVDNPWSLYLAIFGLAAAFGLPIIAFLLRGMVPEGSREWTLAQIKRELKQDKPPHKP